MTGGGPPPWTATTDATPPWRDRPAQLDGSPARGQTPVLQEAGTQDAAELLALREAAAAWLTRRGIRQWEPGEVGIDEVHRQVASGEWHVRREGRQIIAALRLAWQDEAIWGPQPPVAAYIHGLVIERRYAGAGLGSALLGWAAQQATSRDRPLLRLDCVEDNPSLLNYYERHGFRVVGRRDVDARWYPVVLLERDLRPRST